MAIEILNSVLPSILDGKTQYWIEVIALIIELLAILIIAFYLLIGTFLFLQQAIRNQLTVDERFIQYKHTIARALLLGLEILVAADIVRTVALEATLQSVIVLGLLVVIRTFLSWSLTVEIEGRWPWQPEKKEIDVK